VTSQLRRSEGIGGSAARSTATKDAAAQEGSFQRVVAMYTAATEPGDLSGGIQAVNGIAVRTKGARGQISLNAAQGLTGQDVHLHPDQRRGVRVEDAMRSRSATDSVTDKAPRVTDALDLRVLGEGVGHL
jgi:hypothetical protein